MTGIMISNRASLARALADADGGPHYVYLLRRPDGVPCYGGIGTPFYVGIGQGTRLFAHEEEARDPTRTGPKVEAIRAIWAAGGDAVRTIDSVHAHEPWAREEALITAIGGLADEGRGPLAWRRNDPRCWSGTGGQCSRNVSVTMTAFQRRGV